MKKIISTVIILVLLASLAYLAKYGLFASVNLSEKNAGPYLMIYKKHIGNYTEVGEIMDNLCYDLKNNHAITTTKGFGLYYDNPKDVATEKLRSIVGCIIEDKTIEELRNLSNKYNNKYNIKEYPASKSIVAEFPYQGKISIFLGIFRVYPKLEEYITENNHRPTPIMELYDQPNQKILYISSSNLPQETFESFLKTNNN